MNECLNCLIDRRTRDGLVRKEWYHNNSTYFSVKLPFNHGKTSLDKFAVLTLFHTHQTKKSRANEPRLAQPLPLPTATIESLRL